MIQYAQKTAPQMIKDPFFSAANAKSHTDYPAFESGIRSETESMSVRPMSTYSDSEDNQLISSENIFLPTVGDLPKLLRFHLDYGTDDQLEKFVYVVTKDRYLENEFNNIWSFLLQRRLCK